MKKKAHDVLVIKDSVLAQEFGAIEEVIQEEAKELAMIDSDIKAIQSKIKKLNLKIETDICVSLPDGGEVGYSPTNGHLFHMDAAEENYQPLLSLVSSKRKEIHNMHLARLLRHIKDEYILQRELEKESA